MPWTAPISPAAAATATSSGVGAAVDLVNCTTAVLDLTVSAVSGTTPLLTISVETSKDGAVWRALGAFPAASDVGTVTQRFPGADRYLRARWVLGGTTPSFTFAVLGLRVLVYLTPTEFDRMSIKAEALSKYTPSQKDEWIVAAGDDADGIIEAGPHTLPLVSWGDDLRKQIANRATYYDMNHKGFNPAKESPDYLIVKNFDAAGEWFEDIRDRKRVLRCVDSTPEVSDGGGGGMASRPRRRR